MSKVEFYYIFTTSRVTYDIDIFVPRDTFFFFSADNERYYPVSGNAPPDTRPLGSSMTY